MQIIVESIDPEGSRAMTIEEFYYFVAERLDLIDHPVIMFTPKLQTTSFGLYSPSESSVTVATEGRHIVDILRTFAHELVHHKQMEDQPIPSVEELEYEANAVAGMLMRDYAKLHPALFGLSVPTPTPIGTLSDTSAPTVTPAQTGTDTGMPDPTRPSGPINMAEAKIKNTDSDALKLLKLQNAALRAFPSSPRQKEIQQQVVKLREKMVREKTSEYRPPIKEEMSVGSGDVAGIGIGPQGEPGINKKKRTTFLKRAIPSTQKRMTEQIASLKRFIKEKGD